MTHSQTRLPHSQARRERPSRKHFAAGVALLVLAAAGSWLRFDGAFLHYPYFTHVDEGHTVRQAMNMFRAETWDSGWYYYNTGLMNLTNLPIWANHAIDGDLPGFRKTVKVYPRVAPFENYPPEDMERRYGIVNPEIFLFSARVWTAALCSLGILLCYLALAALLPPIYALLGAALFAVTPAMVIPAHYVNNDVPMATATAGLLWMALRWRRSSRYGDAAGAGIFAAAGASLKVTGFFLGAMPGLVVLLGTATWPRKLKAAGLMIGAAAVSFYVFNPGLLGRESQVLGWLFGNKEIYAGKSTAPLLLQAAEASQFGWPILILAALGLLLGMLRQPRVFGPALAALGLYTAPFLLTPFQPVRNFYPAYPIVLLSAVWLFYAGHALLQRRLSASWSGSIVAVAALLLTGWMAAQTWTAQKQWHSQPHSRVAVTDWLEAHAPEGSTVALLHDAAFAPSPLLALAHNKKLALLDVSSFDSLGRACHSADIVVVPAKPLFGKKREVDHALQHAVGETLRREGLERVFTVGDTVAFLYWGYYCLPQTQFNVFARPEGAARPERHFEPGLHLWQPPPYPEPAHELAAEGITRFAAQRYIREPSDASLPPNRVRYCLLAPQAGGYLMHVRPVSPGLESSFFQIEGASSTRTGEFSRQVSSETGEVWYGLGPLPLEEGPNIVFLDASSPIAEIAIMPRTD